MVDVDAGLHIDGFDFVDRSSFGIWHSVRSLKYIKRVNFRQSFEGFRFNVRPRSSTWNLKIRRFLLKTHHFQVPMLNFGGVYRKFSKFFFGFFFWTPQKNTTGTVWTEDSVRRFPIRLLFAQVSFRRSGCGNFCIGGSGGLENSSSPWDKLHHPENERMSPKKGGLFFSKGSESFGPFFVDFQGIFGYSCVFGDMLVSYSFEIWPSKALLEKQADHCGVGISRSEGRDGWRRQ